MADNSRRLVTMGDYSRREVTMGNYSRGREVTSGAMADYSGRSADYWTTRRVHIEVAMT